MCGWPDLVGAELSKSFSETLQGKFDTQGPPVWLSEDHTAFFSVHKQLLHTCIDWKLALTAIDVTEPERQPNQLFFIDMQNQSRRQQDAEGCGYRSDKRLVLRSAGDGDVEYAFSAFPPQNILEQNASFGAILLERAAGIGSVAGLLVRFGGRLSRDGADACGQ
jgi:hypothetical protein